VKSPLVARTLSVPVSFKGWRYRNISRAAAGKNIYNRNLRSEIVDIWKGQKEVRGIRVAAILAVLFFAWCLYFGWTTIGTTDPSTKKIKFILWSVWTLGAPIYFLFEYGILYDPAKHAGREEYKIAQELASKIWIAVATILAALFAGDDILSKIAGGGRGHP